MLLLLVHCQCYCIVAAGAAGCIVACCCNCCCRGASGPYVYAYLSNLDAPDWARPPTLLHSHQKDAGSPSPVSRSTPSLGHSSWMPKQQPTPPVKAAHSGYEVSPQEERKAVVPSSGSAGPCRGTQKASGSREPHREEKAVPVVIDLSDSDEEIPPLRNRVGQALTSSLGVPCPPVTKSSPPSFTCPRVSPPSLANPRPSSPPCPPSSSSSSLKCPRVSPPSQSLAAHSSSTGSRLDLPSTPREGRGGGAKARNRPVPTPAARAAGEAALKRWSTAAKK